MIRYLENLQKILILNAFALKATRYRLESNINDQQAACGCRGKRARDGAAPESGQEDPLREKRHQRAGSYAQSACHFCVLLYMQSHVYV